MLALGKEGSGLTMPLSYSMMKRGLPRAVGCVDGAAMLNEQVDHGHRANGGSPVQRILAALILDAR